MGYKGDALYNSYVTWRCVSQKSLETNTSSVKGQRNPTTPCYHLSWPVKSQYTYAPLPWEGPLWSKIASHHIQQEDKQTKPHFQVTATNQPMQIRDKEITHQNSQGGYPSKLNNDRLQLCVLAVLFEKFGSHTCLYDSDNLSLSYSWNHLDG